MAALIDGRRLVYIGGTSRKFWEWRLYQSDGEAQPGVSYRLLIKWGRIGTTGQSQDEFFSDRRLALWKAEKKEAEKRAKGYKIESLGRDAISVAPRRKALTDEEWLDRIAPKMEAQRAPRREPEPPPLVAVRRVRLRE